MSSTEPPSRIPPRNNHQDKAAREELSNKKKIEKVREVDADETRKRNFLKYYNGEAPDETEEVETRPSPIDLMANRPAKPPMMGANPPVDSDFKDSADAIVASPAYSPPPDVTSYIDLGEEEEPESDLPQSSGFWEEVDFPPDQPQPSSPFQQTPGLSEKTPFQQGAQKGARPDDKKRKAQSEGVFPEKAGGKKEEFSPFGVPGKSEKGMAPFAKPKPEADKKKVPSPFESPLSPSTRLKEEKEKAESHLRAQEAHHKKASQLPAGPAFRPLEKEEPKERGPAEVPPHKKGAKQAQERRENTPEQGASALPFQTEEREGGKGGKRDQRGKIGEIESPSLPSLPAHIQPIATAATAQAAPYINPTTAVLFFQMVGTIYIMAGPQGVNRTEVVLNSPAFADSKFFGATIRIEKYATAPDSFNITLTGSDEAVVSFKENIPSLMAAFQNGNFTFKVNRLDAQYSVERPVFRRREKEEDKGDADGGDLGERRK